MYRSLLLAAVVFVSSCAISSSTPQPTDWPIKSIETSRCTDVAGSYIDPNEVRDQAVNWEGEFGGMAIVNGAADTAWHQFGFKARRISSFGHELRGRGFTLRFDSLNSLIIDYTVDDEIVETRKFSSSEYSCEKGVLKFVTYHREGEDIYNKIPNTGRMTTDVEVFKVDDFLYVKYSSLVRAIAYGVVPMSSDGVSWSRYPSLSPALPPTLPPPRSFRWDISKAGSVIEQDFVVTQNRLYQFVIEFHYYPAPGDLPKFVGTGTFVGPGSDRYVFFTKDPLHPIRVIPQDVGGDARLEELYLSGKLVKRQSLPGVIVPVHIAVEKIDDVTGGSALVTDQSVNTEGRSPPLGNSVISRKIADVKLKPGHYKVKAKTLMDVALPIDPHQELYTALGIWYDNGIPPANQ